MTNYYLDASALVKRYVDEMGSDWVRAAMASTSQPLLFTSRMAIVEVTSAFARRVREGILTPEEFGAIRDAFRGDCLNHYQVIPPTVPIVDLACALVERYPLRAYDATHLASALNAQQFLITQGGITITFLSADDRLNDAASAGGLVVDNPNHHS